MNNNEYQSVGDMILSHIGLADSLLQDIAFATGYIISASETSALECNIYRKDLPDYSKIWPATLANVNTKFTIEYRKNNYGIYEWQVTYYTPQRNRQETIITLTPFLNSYDINIILSKAIFSAISTALIKQYEEEK